MRRLSPLLAVLVLAACSSTPPAPPVAATPPPVAQTQQARPAPPPPVAKPVAPPVDPLATDMARLRNRGDILGKRSVFFELDSYVIRPEFAPLVEAHAALLRRHRQFKVLIQGNADERGSQEYNLALGQRRAEALKKALLQHGASESQVEAVSLGKTKPRAAGHDDAAWSQNRRDDMLYPGETALP